MVRGHLLDCDQFDIIDAVLVADELGNLACEYGDLPASVGVERDPGGSVLRIEVTAERLDMPSSSSRVDTTRRVFENCASGWGRYEEGALTTIWAEIALPSIPRQGGFPRPRVPSC